MSRKNEKLIDKKTNNEKAQAMIESLKVDYEEKLLKKPRDKDKILNCPWYYRFIVNQVGWESQ